MHRFDKDKYNRFTSTDKHKDNHNLVKNDAKGFIIIVSAKINNNFTTE